MPKLGCSTRIVVIVVIALLVITFIGFALGGIVRPESGFAPEPHVELPSYTLVHLFSIGGLDFRITNTIMTTWISMAVLIIFAFLVTRRLKPVPGRLQSFVEEVVGGLYNFVEGIAGKEYGRRFFALVATIFLIVIANAWLSLIPGFVSIWVEPHHHTPLFRGGNTDINLPLALALISFVCVEFWGMKALKPWRNLNRFFKFDNLRRGFGDLLRGRLKQGIIGLMQGGLDIYVGFLEGMSELVRILSFTFRLFGNMTAGEVLLLTAGYLFTVGLVNITFYGLELFLGFVQALIFAGLTLIFATLAVTPHGEEEHA